MEQYRLDFNDHHAMENATWVLTQRESNEVIECNYSKMSEMVGEGYVQYHNERYSDSIYDQPEITLEDVRVRFIGKGGCHIARIKERLVEGVGYNQILPQYDIECYGYSYQCKECKRPLKETEKRGHKKPERLFCLNCLDMVEVY